MLSYPSPDRAVRLDQLRAGRAVPRRYRNRRIGEFLKELDLTEGRATGIPKILRAMRTNGSPLPEFETDDDYSYFMVRLSVHPGASRVMTPQVIPQVTPQVEEAILIFCEHSRSAAEIQTQMGFRDRKHFQTAYLRPMLEAGWLARTIPDKPNSRNQRYITTEKGKQHIQHLVNAL